ncbi:SubName: Full=Uncharacterized protein {ECO:0000313/EMBL:CCA70320.1} [Serendipita indica DSM 11827]|uniref:Uncharacterized protein n=1 Tax=Serendipita indica (strain DSM 11827) TaxID=1109443 RepID=G4TG77_SERID|nr:SubName: Full=Uncharacterized protein {ECO:0000313/EMBL:CCA70320.1} [Serendipita indica DSM 11827]CCA70320.1 hypothetical protein PIIN_04259 [Serendipita indica DSM 11827]
MSTAGVLSSPRITTNPTLPSRPTSPRPILSTTATSPQQRRETTRSEQMLRDMLTKDGVARQRSLSRSSSTFHHPLPQPLPIGPGTTSSSRGRHGRNESVKTIQNSTDPSSRALGDWELPAQLCTDLGLSRETRTTASFRLITVHITLWIPPGRRLLPTATPLRRSSALASTTTTRQEPVSPSPTSMNSSGWNSPHQNRTPSPSSSTSHPTSPSPTHSGTFNLDVASEYCKQQRGYVSFGDVEGLGRPAGEEEDERAERERIDAEMRRRKWWPSWLETLDAGARSRPKTPAPED